MELAAPSGVTISCLEALPLSELARLLKNPIREWTLRSNISIGGSQSINLGLAVT